MKIAKIIGRRGACGYAPENTLESIKSAAGLGVEWVQMDVKLSADNVPVLFFDDTLERTTNGAGAFADKSLEELEGLDAGGWYAAGFEGAKIPSLEEAIDVLLEFDLGVVINLCPTQGREVDTAEAVLDCVSRVYDAKDKVVILAAQAVCLEACFEIAPDYKRALDIGAELPEDLTQLIDYLKPDFIAIDDQNITREQIEDVIDAGLPVGCYAVNDAFRAKTLFSWGVDFVFSDVPDTVEGLTQTRH